MATIGNIIQRVQSLYSKGAQSNSTRLMSRQIYDKMLSTRSFLLYNKINKRQFISKWNYIILPCVELVSVTGNDCPCVVPVGCNILRTKHKLPKPIHSNTGYIIDGVTSVDGNHIFNEVTYKSKKWRKGDKYTSTKPDFFILDDYIYITSTRKLKALYIMGLFVDPMEAKNFPSKCSDSETVACPDNPKNLEFPLDEELIDALVKMTLEEMVIGFPLGDEDRRNDSQDKIETPQSPRGQQRQQRQQQQDPNE
jgi:hypothetical protein